MKCTNCLKENPERNYYCTYCGYNLKNLSMNKNKTLNRKLNERYKYVLHIEALEDSSRDIDYFLPYRSKKGDEIKNEGSKNNK